MQVWNAFLSVFSLLPDDIYFLNGIRKLIHPKIVCSMVCVRQRQIIFANCFNVTQVFVVVIFVFIHVTVLQPVYQELYVAWCVLYIYLFGSLGTNRIFENCFNVTQIFFFLQCLQCLQINVSCWSCNFDCQQKFQKLSCI